MIRLCRTIRAPALRARCDPGAASRSPRARFAGRSLLRNGGDPSHPFRLAPPACRRTNAACSLVKEPDRTHRPAHHSNIGRGDFPRAFKRRFACIFGRIFARRGHSSAYALTMRRFAAFFIEMLVDLGVQNALRKRLLQLIDQPVAAENPLLVAPRSSWSNMSFSIAIARLHSSHFYGPPHKTPDSPVFIRRRYIAPAVLCVLPCYTVRKNSAGIAALSPPYLSAIIDHRI